MKKLLTVLLSFMLVAVVFTGCKKTTTPPQSAQTIRIGVGVPLTGTTATEGNCVLRGAEIAARDINSAGGINGQQVELVVMDNRADPKEAANIANLFVQDKSILGVIEGAGSALCLAGAPIYNGAKLVHITIGASSPKVSLAGDYTFRVWANDTFRVAFDAQILLDAGYSKVGCMYQNDDFGRGGLTVLQDLLAKKGLKVLVAEGFLPGETKDFNTVITKMRSAGCDSVFCLADEGELALFAKQCAQQGWKPFMASTGTYRPHLIALGGEAVEGVVGDTFYDPNNIPAKVAAFFAKLNVGNTKTGVTVLPNSLSACAYDATGMMLQAIKNGAKTRVDIQKYLASLKNYDGIVGTLSFDENGDVAIPFVRIVIKEGKYVVYPGT